MFKIAICDDDKNYIENICTLLATTHTPCEIYTFSSGRELVESELLFDFELIFLDIVMSDMDGIETRSHLSMTT
ncbi:MAG: response regulator, partial [Eubacteriales bacterium]